MNNVSVPKNVRRIVEMALSASLAEVDCEEVSSRLAAHLETTKLGRLASPALSMVAEHLLHCASCAEEMRLLASAISKESRRTVLIGVVGTQKFYLM